MPFDQIKQDNDIFERFKAIVELVNLDENVFQDDMKIFRG